jgi:hypothetical protein
MNMLSHMYHMRVVQCCHTTPDPNQGLSSLNPQTSQLSACKDCPPLMQLHQKAEESIVVLLTTR